MHELSLCESLIGVIEDQAEVQDYRRVNRVRLEIGTLACVEPEALRFCFDLVACGTLADGAELQIIEMKPEARCLACGQAVSVLQRFDACPDCGSHRLQVSGGDQLRIKELEVD